MLSNMLTKYLFGIYVDMKQNCETYSSLNILINLWMNISIYD